MNVREISERLMGAAFVAGFDSCDRIYQSPSNVCYLQIAGKSGDLKRRRKIRVDSGDSLSMDDCSAVLSVGGSSIMVLRRDGERRTFPESPTHEWTAFALEG
jgi:hypothetical protein